MTGSLAGAAAIAGIGQTEFSKESGRSELQLACEAVSAALDDAGVAPGDVDGMVTFTMDASDEIEVARNVGIGDLDFFSRVPHGGGAAAGTVAHAAMAVATGVAEVVVCYRAFNERSGMRFGGSGRTSGETPLFMAHYAPFGLLTPAAWVALHAQRYMSTYGVTNEHFGAIAVVDRAHAARNPDAWFYQRPITLADHQNSRWIVEPVLRLLDCCQESDGGVALVVTSAARARNLRQPPAVITAAAQGAASDGEMMTSYYREDITGLPEMRVVAGGCGGIRVSNPPTSKPPLFMTISRLLSSFSSRSSASAGAVRPRTSPPSRTCRWAACCRSTPTVVCWARPTSMA
ncbi:putative exopolyphosphatase [Mycobacterium kansasii]|uniref:Putative exopolyphosphatase n=1 Tax=Mycobacterium kansasii TaxID=1768 RepID=A0A1V3XMI6_MYCKA|nr:putative exopolyphosphatase [Mycobacterium kansasii]